MFSIEDLTLANTESYSYLRRLSANKSKRFFFFAFNRANEQVTLFKYILTGVFIMSFVFIHRVQ